MRRKINKGKATNPVPYKTIAYEDGWFLTNLKFFWTKRFVERGNWELISNTEVICSMCFCRSRGVHIKGKEYGQNVYMSLCHKCWNNINSKPSRPRILYSGFETKK